MKNFDLFGNEVIEPNTLKNKYIIPPFSIFDTASGDWQNRKNKWKSLGIESEVGRENSNSNQRMTPDGKMIGLKSKKTSTIRLETTGNDITKNPYISIFDPVLCEVIYNWFAIPNGTILDPFAGGSVRGIVANYLDYQYTGIDLREEQILSNQSQALKIVPDNLPEWIDGDSNVELNKFDRTFDFVFSCPPYYDLEVYCDDPNDLSNMDYNSFNAKYESIINKSCKLLRDNRFACFVVGNVRDKDGYMIDLVGQTIKSFENAGLKFYNEIILKNAVASASMRADNNMTYKKVVKIHQNVLVFCKGNPKSIV
tara:strand:+ start:635 stop:1567 length:933 start_codon:yes stop_codon:yes gene_type:complete